MSVPNVVPNRPVVPVYSEMFNWTRGNVEYLVVQKEK